MHKDLQTNLHISRLVARLRDKNTESEVFRRNLTKLGEYIAIESLQELGSIEKTVETPLAPAQYLDIEDELVIIGILRAALPMTDGVLSVLPEASVGFLSASRGRMTEQEGRDFEIITTYSKLPDCSGRTVFIVDPMLASASTMLKAIDDVKKMGPKKVIVLSALAARFGVERLEKSHPDVSVYIGALDEELNDKGYIVPGLGDAGDRAFNT